MITNPNDYAYASDTSLGLTKREYFAALAMQGMLANSSPQSEDDFDSQDIAQCSVEYADAIIDALNEPRGIHEI